jgi:hypothetical protein
MTQEHSEVIARSCEAERLTGLTITGALTDVENNRWGLQLCNERGEYFNAWIDADPEGNGPGWLDVRHLDDDTPFLRQ